MRLSRGFLRAPVVGYGWVRLLPLLGATGSVALLHIPGVEPSASDWVVASVSAALVLTGGRRPLSVALAQSAVLLTAMSVAPVAAAVVQVMACVALGEVAFRRPGGPTWWGAVAVGVASALNVFPSYTVAAKVLIVVLDVGLPLLLGSFLRAQRELAAQAEERAVEAERSRAWEVSATRAKERAAVASELHDVVAHHVAAIVLRVGVVRHVVQIDDPRLDEALRDVYGIGGQALTDLRALVSVLRDPASVDDAGLLTPADLSSALDTVVERTRQAGVAVRTDIDSETVERLSTARRHAVLRVVQEGLTNVLKHAGPDVTARLVLRCARNGQVEIEVSDDGGRERPASRPDPGHGLIVTRERVELLHGRLRAGPEGPGWALHAELPDDTAVPESAT